MKQGLSITRTEGVLSNTERYPVYNIRLGKKKELAGRFVDGKYTPGGRLLFSLAGKNFDLETVYWHISKLFEGRKIGGGIEVATA